MEILGEVVLRPQFSPEELEMCEMTIGYVLLVKALMRSIAGPQTGLTD